MTFSGMTQADAERFETYATAMAQAPGMATFVADMSFVQTEREEISFAGGQAVDLSNLDEAATETLANEIMTQAAKLGMSLIAHPSLMNDLMTLIGG